MNIVCFFDTGGFDCFPKRPCRDVSRFRVAPDGPFT
jgi:hypothetical protein